MKRWLALALLLTACERDNGNFCDVDRPCAVGACNLVTKQCETADAGGGGGDLSGDDFAGADLSMPDGPSGCPNGCSGTTPICQGNTCVACGTAGGDTACMQLSQTTPHCLGNGECAQCRTFADCSDPSKAICDSNTHRCRGCTADSDCTSMVCDLTPGSPTLGQCVTNVVYVDGNNTTNCPNGDGSMANPVCPISKGITIAGNNGAPVVHIANIPGGSYSSENLVINNTNITLVGATGATISPTGNNNPAIDVKGTSTVVLRNLTFSKGAGTNGNGITCETSTSLTVLSSTVTNNNQYGILDMGCVMLTVDRSWIGALSGGSGNMTGGIFVSHGFRLTNNIIVKNGTTAVGSGGGISVSLIGSAPVRDINSNTIADNQGSGTAVGVGCANGTVPVLNSILWNNSNSVMIAESNCPTSYCGDDAPLETMQTNNVALSTTKTPAFSTTNPYHIMSNSPLRQVGAPNGISDHDYDGQARPDPATGKSDIGADEYYP
jgi:hypothetical protein